MGNLFRNLLTCIGIFLCGKVTVPVWHTWFYVTNFAERIGTTFKFVNSSQRFVVLHLFLIMAVIACVGFNF